MPRANRFFLPHHVWHITHRCHKQDFLLKFACDRQRWVHWLCEARKRYQISILNYTVTSNHIHLLIWDNSAHSEIPAAVQLVAGRVAQEFNQRKKRKGAFWEDRYHATAVETGAHLWRCLTYIDLNMFRAGVVDHPREWPFGGYHEIQDVKRRNTILDMQALLELLEVKDCLELRKQHQAMIDDALVRNRLDREGRWTECIAAGSRSFVLSVQDQLKARGRRRKVLEEEGVFVVREGLTRYGAVLDVKNWPIT